jgi:hypothetical protein
VSRIECIVFVGCIEHLLETRKVVSQILKNGSALPEDCVSRKQGAVSRKDERDRIGGVPGTLQNLELPVAGIRSRRQDRWNECLPVCEIMEGAASRCGSVVTVAQLRRDLLKDGIVLGCREGEFVYAWREERLLGAALDPQFTAEAEHRR